MRKEQFKEIIKKPKIWHLGRECMETSNNTIYPLSIHTCIVCQYITIRYLQERHANCYTTGTFPNNHSHK